MKKIGPKGMTAARSATGSRETGAPAAPSAQPWSDVPQLHVVASPQRRGPRSSSRAGSGQRGAGEGCRATGSAMGSAAAASQGRAALMINAHSLLLQQQARSSHSSLSANA